MAEFCKQCSIDVFGEDFGDFKGETHEDEWQQGKAVCVLCESCGPIQVDPEGNCVTHDYWCKGQKGHGLPWVRLDS